MRVNKDMPTYANKTFRNIGTGGTNVYQRIQNVSGGGGSARASGVGISIRNNTTGFSESLNLLPTAVNISSINYQKNPGGRYATENWQYTFNLETGLLYPVLSVSTDNFSFMWNIQMYDSATYPNSGVYGSATNAGDYDSMEIDTIAIQFTTRPTWISLAIF